MTAYFASPTPIASAVSSLLLITLLACLYAAYRALFSKPKSPGEKGLFTRVMERGRRVERASLRAVGWVTGTRYKNRPTRLAVLLAYFLGLTAAAVLAPWPWPFLPILFGVLGILFVFRHWSIDEDETQEASPHDMKMVPLVGDLHIEVKLAVSFLLVFAPIAFATLQEHGQGFQ